MTTDKPIVYALVEILTTGGIMKYTVLSPGSRNAPLIHAFAAKKEIKCLSIVDERSAAFFALGIAQQTGLPVAVVCTSGTAVLNYAPAIAEAYYQKIPLLIITADRPPELIDKEDGQTIRQVNIFANYIRNSFNLPVEMKSRADMKRTIRIAGSAYQMTGGNELFIKGPVHINVPLREPLYGLTDVPETSELFKEIDKAKRRRRPSGCFMHRPLSEKEKKEISQVWHKAKSKLIICGMSHRNDKLNSLLGELARDSSVAVFTETTSNMQDKNFISNIDPLIETWNEKEQINNVPDLLITFGGPVTSKKLKLWLRKNKPKQHWQISEHNVPLDPYNCHSKAISLDEYVFFNFLTESTALDRKAGYGRNILKRSEKALSQLSAFCKKAPFCDLKAFQIIVDNLPDDSNVQLGNSTPVRYANLFRFEREKNLQFFSNRGVSGIDGTVSTAAGAAFCTDKITTLITGDLGFFYDSNILWNKYLTKNLRVIIINNGGGGIFRLIDGAKDSPLLKDFIETRHNLKAEKLIKSYRFPFYSAKNEEELKEKLPLFFKQHRNKPVFMEICTPTETNALQYSNYFKSLKTV